ncbi:MAG: hypothetical protein GQF41_1545 [Candidatus Rifleibacterium amylolyticum]|nr:MAG: hypothetical protein GQF41_1545 [Candidatus Rifleibacterium amylolyticum]
MLEILITTLIVAITALGSLLSIFGLLETAAIFKQCLDITSGATAKLFSDISESVAGGELLTLLFLLF